MKNLLIKWGFYIPKEQPEMIVEEVNEVAAAMEKVEAQEVVNDFVEMALSRYCKICDEFYKRPHSLYMHSKFKHKAF